MCRGLASRKRKKSKKKCASAKGTVIKIAPARTHRAGAIFYREERRRFDEDGETEGRRWSGTPRSSA